MALVEINHLSKQFEKDASFALKEINFRLEKGKMIGLVGPDGSGKTTLMRLLAGLLLPSSGSIQVPEKIGYMPQKFGQYGDLTVGQNLDLYADLMGVTGEERRERFDLLLKFTSLTPFKDRLARALSGGMKQKLAIACSLIQKPTLLLLDEPSVGVDPISRQELWKMAWDLLEDDISIIWSTSYLDEAEKCHEVLLMSEGEALFGGNPEEFKNRVQDRVFRIDGICGSRRTVLMDMLQNDQVIDGVIEGSQVRLVVKEKFDESLKETTPRFEDAFIDFLGSGPPKKSLLAEMRGRLEKKDGAVISAENLTKKFGEFTAVDGVSLDVKRGEIFGLLGPNGAGKTTTFKMLCGLLNPTFGKASVNGLDLQAAPALARQQIGYMAQRFSLYGSLSVKQNLEFFSGCYNLEGSAQKEAVDSMINVFGLEPFINTSCELLPLGFKQRLALACANMHSPEILFLDEPTSGVDPITRREFWSHINGLVEKGVTVMITTHFMDEAEYCDRIALCYKGKLIRLSEPDELKKEACSKEVPDPTLEEAFIHYIREFDERSEKGQSSY